MTEKEMNQACTMNGWPKKKIMKTVCKHCDDETCYKYNTVDRSPKQKKEKKRVSKFESDPFQELLE